MKGLPAYERFDRQPPPYPTNDLLLIHEPPQTYIIGRKWTNSPLVTSVQVKNHLALLHAFVQLRTSIDDLQVVPDGILFLPTDKDRRWTWFVKLAVERFSRWCNNLVPSDLQDTNENLLLPPLDVLMVWHAYLLNPLWYAEDTYRVPGLRSLRKFTPIFSKSLSAGLDNLLTSEPTEARRSKWEAQTGRSFDPLEDAFRTQERSIYCPQCRSLIPIPYMNSEGTGYFQQNFRVNCPRPGCTNLPYITREVLGARKLVEDLAWSYLAGTLHTSTAVNVERGKTIKDAILVGMKQKKGSLMDRDVFSILKQNKFDLEKLRAVMVSKMRAAGLKLIGRVMSAYRDGDMFSIDLAGAVIRQGSFVKKMHELHWTDPQFFASAEDEVALQNTIARYHAFLDLMSASLGTFYVPTLDIDLAWHTHQLMGETYNENCFNYVGRYVDHNDKVEEDKLATAFDLTCRAWEDRFGIPYTHCGCPLPGQSIGERLSYLVGVHTKQKQPLYLVPPLREDLWPATHPSDHNAVFLFHRAGKAAQRRQRARFEKHKKREAAGATTSHDPAFLVPVPLYYGYGSGCAAYSGNVVNSSNGIGDCAAGGGACSTGAPVCSAAAACGTGKCGGSSGSGSGWCGGGGGGGCGGCGGCGGGGG